MTELHYAILGYLMIISLTVHALQILVLLGKKSKKSKIKKLKSKIKTLEKELRKKEVEKEGNAFLKAVK